ncbi:hypothetical protein GCM10010191_68710 [Actinomadura vinacea]|uniref:Uncharacterized protein n=1 Tax=Actinomadura vinacea TaxID=115336 RepID=A0ABN3JY42_9ACTN
MSLPSTSGRCWPTPSTPTPGPPTSSAQSLHLALQNISEARGRLEPARAQVERLEAELHEAIRHAMPPGGGHRR